MLQFIYQPKSGDRVVAEIVSPWMVVIQWSNRCRHVVGNFVVLSWSTANPGCHWRGDAIRALQEIIPQIGGIAWDEQGNVSAAVPTHQARMVLEIMGRLSLNDREDRRRNLAVMWKAGAAYIRLTDGGGLDIEPSCISPAPQVAHVTKVVDGNQEQVEVYMAGMESYYTVKSPWSVREITSSVQAEKVYVAERVSVEDDETGGNEKIQVSPRVAPVVE